MKVYAVQFKFCDTSMRDLDLLLPYLNAERVKRINKFLKFEDKFRSAIAGLLQRYMFRTNYPDSKLPVYAYNAFGKPSFENVINYEFNTSHSGEWVVGACNKDAVGIDIEKINPKTTIINRILSKTERESINALPAIEQQQLFFEFWVLKESHVKAIGQGLYYPLEHLSCYKSEKKIELQTTEGKSDFQYKLFSIDPQYKMAICSTTVDFSQKVTILTVKDLIGNG